MLPLKTLVLSVAQFVFLLCATPLAFGQGTHQTPAETLTPLQFGGLPYTIEVTEVDFGSAELATLHSYSAAKFGGLWVLMAGRTNGIHGLFATDGFPTESQNRDVWVIDPINLQTWHRTLDESQGFSEYQFNALTCVNNQFYTRGDQLYLIGGYGVQTTDSGGIETFGTFDTLAAVDLPGIIDWVQNGTGTASDNIRIIQHPTLKVTGGDVGEIAGRTHLVFGQDFDGTYNPGSNGSYTNQVRSFEIIDDGTNLSIANASVTLPVDEYRRRDLNVFATMRLDGKGGLEEGITALSGFFTPPPGFGAWTVPVEIDENGLPDVGGLPDPDAPGTFRQGFNGYHSAKVGLFSESTGEMHEILFGGISLQEYDPVEDVVNADDLLPFINNITSVVVDAGGNYSQHYLGDFPELFDLEGNRLRFGANAEFFLADGVSIYNNDVIQLDTIAGEVTIGYIFGGLTSNAPHPLFGSGVSAASNTLFRVTLKPVTVLGDADGNGQFNNLDIASFVMALINPTAYQAKHPDVDPTVVLDMNGDGGFDNLDIAGFVAALVSGG